MLMTIIVLISLTGHVVVAGVCNNFIPLSIPNSLYHQQALQKVVFVFWFLPGRITQIFIPEWCGPLVSCLDLIAIIFH